MALAPFGFGGSLMGRDPVVDTMRSLMTFPDEFSSLFEGPVSAYVRDTSAMANTAVDVKETPQAYVFTADLPGLKRDEVKVQVEDNHILVISGERTREQKQESDRYHRMERATGKFMRRFRLPNDSDPQSIKANCEHGVLSVTVPKRQKTEQEQRNVRPIDVQ